MVQKETWFKVTSYFHDMTVKVLKKIALLFNYNCHNKYSNFGCLKLNLVKSYTGTYRLLN